eukprot:TRINITY_DN164_c0_g1_i2.p1 TRINITY_DN164_c0_g1~~TRINITY_DN164_c0_g1_i2.p1  ORF type:complete len:154 (+),score=12.52 TRINITY_DN164_c0_g1_i2:314-775(+)
MEQQQKAPEAVVSRPRHVNAKVPYSGNYTPTQTRYVGAINRSQPTVTVTGNITTQREICTCCKSCMAWKQRNAAGFLPPISDRLAPETPLHPAHVIEFHKHAVQCKYCKESSRKSKTNFWCGSCVVPLHPKKCFKTYHANMPGVLPKEDRVIN